MGYQIAGAVALHCFFCLGQWSAGEVKLWSYHRLEDFQINTFVCIPINGNVFFMVSFSCTMLKARQTVYHCATREIVLESGRSQLKSRISHLPVLCLSVSEGWKPWGWKAVSRTAPPHTWLCSPPSPLLHVCQFRGAPPTNMHPAPTVGQVWYQPLGTHWGAKADSVSVFKSISFGFPGGAVVKNPPSNAGDTGSSPGPGRSHVPRSN